MAAVTSGAGSTGGLPLKDQVRDLVERQRSERKAEIEASLAEVPKAAMEAGILPGDPLHPLIGALTRLAKAVGDGTEPLTRQVQATADAEADRLTARAAELERQSAKRLTAVIEQAGSRAAGVERAVRWRAAALIACAVAVVGAGGAAGGFAVGWRQGQAAVAVTEREVAEAFRYGPGAAAAWATLLRNNDPEEAVRACRALALEATGGRRACYVPLWIEPAPAVPRLSGPD